MKRLVAATIILLFISINARSFIFNSLETDKNRRMIKTQLNAAFKSYDIVSHQVETYNKETKKAPDKNKFELDFKKNDILSKATNGPMGDVVIKFSKEANPSLKNKTIRVIPKEKEKEKGKGTGKKDEVIYDFDKTITLTDMSLKVSGFSFEKKSVDYSISPQISGSDFGPSFTVNDPEDLTTDTYEEAKQEIEQTQKEQEAAAQKQDDNNNKNNNGNNNNSSSDGPTSTSSSIGTGSASAS
jgi:hypothetical protein